MKKLKVLLIILLLSNSTIIQLRAQVLPQDSLALVALYNATDGPNWRITTDWLIKPVPTWYGITVNGNRVTELNLGQNYLNGGIPREIEDLTQLRFVNLNFNTITSLPDEIGNLINLEQLYLQDCEISVIPSTITNLLQLQILQILMF